MPLNTGTERPERPEKLNRNELQRAWDPGNRTTQNGTTMNRTDTGMDRKKLRNETPQQTEPDLKETDETNRNGPEVTPERTAFFM